jgi:hypothetical protein
MATHVPFITVEDDDDLIVSFGLGRHAETSLTLIRTPMYEPMLSEEDRGVSVSKGGKSAPGAESLVSITWGAQLVRIQSTRTAYVLDVSAVGPLEVSDAKLVLRKMNFDARFEVNEG